MTLTRCTLKNGAPIAMLVRPQISTSLWHLCTQSDKHQLLPRVASPRMSPCRRLNLPSVRRDGIETKKRLLGVDENGRSRLIRWASRRMLSVSMGSAWNARDKSCWRNGIAWKRYCSRMRKCASIEWMLAQSKVTIHSSRKSRIIAVKVFNLSSNSSTWYGSRRRRSMTLRK